MPQNFSELVLVFIKIIALILPLLVALSLLVFFWGLFKFIAKADDVKTHTEGKFFMIWGLVGLFLMISFISIINFFYDDIGFNFLENFGVPLLPT